MKSSSNPYATANYTGDENPLIGTEFIWDDCETPLHRPLPYLVQDFWQWAYSDLLRNTQRAVFAEYVVKMALELGGCHVNQGIRSAFEPYDLLGPSIGDIPSKIEVKSAAKVQAWKVVHPDRISFSIAPAKVPDETGDYPHNAPRQRNCDIYIFCIYNPLDKNGEKIPDANVLNMKYWFFYVCSTAELSRLDYHVTKSDSIGQPFVEVEYRKTITEKIIVEKLHRSRLRFSELYDGIVSVCSSLHREEHFNEQ